MRKKEHIETTTSFNNPYLNREQTACLLGIHTRTLDRLICDRKFPVIRVGGVIRFSESDVREWMEAYRQATIEELVSK